MGRSPRLCGIWVGLALLFGGGLWALEGSEAGETYFAGYVMEKALSLDNVFVFTLIFSALAVPCEEQPRILLWGVLIALVLRAAFIFAGAEALESYSWGGLALRRPSGLAVDSVPAILAITTDTFVVFSANAFALLGLRALFFLVAGAVACFAYLQLALGILLIGIAGKLAYGELTGERIPTAVTFGSIARVLAVAIGASLLKERA